MIVVFLVITEDRNNLEKLTLAVLTHLPTAVLYVHDLTGECGTSPSDQVYSKKQILMDFIASDVPKEAQEFVKCALLCHLALLGLKNTKHVCEPNNWI